MLASSREIADQWRSSSSARYVAGMMCLQMLAASQQQRNRRSMAFFGLCDICNGNDLQAGEDGYFYCSVCGSQSQQFQEQALDHEDAAAYTTRQRNVAVPREGEAEGEGAAAAEEDVKDGILLSSHGRLGGEIGFAGSPRPWEAAWGPGKARAPPPSQPVDPMETMDSEAAAVRSLYIEGLQYIMQLQCETLVQTFQASPLICGIFGPIWLRFISFTCVLEKDWGREAVQIEDARNERSARPPEKMKKRKKKEEDLQEELEGSKDKVQMKVALRFIWLKALKERIPLAASLAIIFLACHIAGEAILPTDIVHWALRGTLPYLAAFNEVEKKKSGLVWPISARVMFKPIDVIGAKRLEFMAASIAQRIGLHLPPVNYDAISCRLLKDLNLPVERLSTFVRRIFDWYRPPGLCLSDKAHALPTRVYVMAMVMITLKILYKIDGRPYQKRQDIGCGKEVGSRSDRLNLDHQAQIRASHSTKKDNADVSRSRGMVDESMESLMKEDKGSSYDGHLENLRRADNSWSVHTLLEKLEKSWKDHAREPFDYERDIVSYIEYCQNIIFTGLELEREEESLCEHLRTLYEHPTNQKKFVPQKKPVTLDVPEVQSLSGDSHISLASFNVRGSQKEESDMMCELADSKVDSAPGTGFDDMPHCKKDMESFREFPCLENLLHHMESLGFQCLAPRKGPLTESKYLRYYRCKASSKNDNTPPQLVHADYFMVLCACAHVIRVHPSSLHWCIQRLERCVLGREKGSSEFLNRT